jgi:hypothetical protein
MKIEWRKVTWYSKLLALGLFVALPFIGFYYGTRYGETVALLQNPGAAQTATGTDYYHNAAAWQTDRDDRGGFSIAYPLDFQVDENYSTQPSTDWREGANGTPGNLSLTITIPKAFEPQTNFADAKLTVGRSGNNAAAADCLVPDATGANTRTSTIMANGIQFTAFHSAGAGAGNYYETTSYRTIHAGQCYAVEYTIHSTQIANYPPEYQLKPFDKAKLVDMLNRIVGTFKFL